MDEKITFILGDKLPWVFEAVEAIINIAPGGSPKEKNETSVRKKAVNAYVSAVRKLWEKAFGTEHVMSRKTTGRTLRDALQVYFNEVSSSHSKLSQRELINRWRKLSNVNILLDLLKVSSNPDSFESTERSFYLSQRNEQRIGVVTEDIDDNYEPPNMQTEEDAYETEPMNIDGGDESDNDDEYVCDIDDDVGVRQEVRQTRSGTVLNSPEPIPITPKPQIRKKRNCTDEIKGTIAKISYECGISVEKSRKVYQIASKEMYGHEYFLSLEEKERKKGLEPQEKKKKITDIDYDKYSDILPSAKSIRRYKNLQATQDEVNAAVALSTKRADNNVTLHFDTTSRNYIDGEWPALILNFSQGKRYTLRPVFFAYEDKENIIELIHETYQRLAVAAEVKLSQEVTAKHLWERTNNTMTDSVSKNLGIGKEIAKKLGSKHIPNSLICNAHVVEKFDATNLEVLADIENKVGLRKRLEAVNPSLRPFFRGQKAIVLAGIQAVLKLVTHDKSGNTVSLAEEFDDLLQRENLVKHMTLYKERRFTKLGYTAASILCALPQLRTLLHETWKNNLLVEACRLYVDCELFVAELHVLAVFTKQVTLPFLNAMEKLTQKQLVEMFPRLYKDLLEHKTDTLKDFLVVYHHIPVDDVKDGVEKKILDRMCEEAAKGFDLQRGKEYGFGETGMQRQRETTNIHTMAPEKMDEIVVVHNLSCERLLGTFGQRAVVAKFRNRKFTAQGIRDDVVLAKSDTTVIESTTRKINMILNIKEKYWTEEQKKLQSLRIQKKITESKAVCDYTQKLLKSCKQWGGPVVTPNELEEIVGKHSDLAEKIIKTELSYYCRTHECQRRLNPDLFKIMITHDERLENLLILLGNNDNVASSSSSSIVDLPTLDELKAELGGASEKKSLHLDEMCVVAWLEDKPRWYLGNVTKKVGDTYTVEHLSRANGEHHEFWRHPEHPDIANVCEEQLIEVKINGDWEIEKVVGERVVSRYHLRNSIEINNVFKKLGQQ